DLFAGRTDPHRVQRRDGRVPDPGGAARRALGRAAAARDRHRGDSVRVRPRRRGRRIRVAPDSAPGRRPRLGRAASAVVFARLEGVRDGPAAGGARNLQFLRRPRQGRGAGHGRLRGDRHRLALGLGRVRGDRRRRGARHSGHAGAARDRDAGAERAIGGAPRDGLALNGTSSVLYGSVADLVTTDRRSRAYGLYYTVTIAPSALAPSVYGIAGDIVGVRATLVIVASVVLATLPLCLMLRASVAEPARV